MFGWVLSHQYHTLTELMKLGCDVFCTESTCESDPGPYACLASSLPLSDICIPQNRLIPELAWGLHLVWSFWCPCSCSKASSPFTVLTRALLLCNLCCWIRQALFKRIFYVCHTEGLASVNFLGKLFFQMFCSVARDWIQTLMFITTTGLHLNLQQVWICNTKPSHIWHTHEVFLQSE